MSFITIVLALLLERFTSRVEQLRSFIWLPRYAQAVRARAEGFGLGGTAALVVTIALPLVAVGLIFTLLGGVWGGVPGFVLSLAVLLFCLGPRNLDREVDAFLEAGALKDTEREARHAAQVLGDRPVPDGPVERARAVLEALLSESNGRVFAVLYGGAGENEETMKIAAESTGNTFLEHQVKTITVPMMMARGTDVIQAMQASGVFLPMLIARFRSGAETGSVRDSAEEMADLYEG
ncbi:MAG: hypothetical protein ACLFSK_07445, partial [Ectothiorhodospira sp.]